MIEAATQFYRSDGVEITERPVCYADAAARSFSVAEELTLRGEHSHEFEGSHPRFGLAPGFSLSTCDARARQDFSGAGSCGTGLAPPECWTETVPAGRLRSASRHQLSQSGSVAGDKGRARSKA